MWFFSCTLHMWSHSHRGWRSLRWAFVPSTGHPWCHMCERALFVLVLSLFAFSHFYFSLPQSICSLTCTSISTKWSPPRAKTTAHTHIEEYRTVAIYNPLTVWRKVRLRYCRTQAWMKHVGQIPWDAHKNSEKVSWMMKFLNMETLTSVLLMKYLQSPYSRDVRICVNTVLKLIYLKTEIARSLKGPKLQGHHAEDAIEELYFVLEILVTCPQWQLRISKQSPICSRGAGFRHSMDPDISVQDQKKLHKKPKETFKISWSPIGSLKSVTLIIPWNSANLLPSLLESLHVYATQIRNIWNAERAVRREKKGTSAVLLQSGLNESWWADSMECDTYLRYVTELLSDGKTSYERRFGEFFRGPIIPFGLLVEYYPISAKDQSRIHKFGRSLTWIVPWIRSVRKENLVGWRTDRSPWRVGDDGCIGNLVEKTQCKGSNICKHVEIHFSSRRWTIRNSWRISGTENIHLYTGPPNSRRRS